MCNTCSDAPKYTMMKNAAAANRVQPMTVSEAHKVLGTTPEMPYAVIEKIYQRQFTANENFLYVQSKIFRAKECIDAQLAAEGFDFSSVKRDVPNAEQPRSSSSSERVAKE